jgi:hypothetical protein
MKIEDMKINTLYISRQSAMEFDAFYLLSTPIKAIRGTGGYRAKAIRLYINNTFSYVGILTDKDPMHIYNSDDYLVGTINDKRNAFKCILSYSK